MYTFIMPQLFTFGPEFFVVGTQTIVKPMLNDSKFNDLSGSFLFDNLIIIFLELFPVF